MFKSILFINFRDYDGSVSSQLLAEVGNLNCFSAQLGNVRSFIVKKHLNLRNWAPYHIDKNWATCLMFAAGWKADLPRVGALRVLATLV